MKTGVLDLSHIKAVLVDLDGTIVNSLPDRIKAISYMLNVLQLPPIEINKVQSFIGQGVYVLVHKTLLESTKNTGNIFNDHQIQQAAEIYERYYLAHICEHSYLYPNVIETLKELTQRNIKLALVSNKRTIHSQKLIETLKLKPFFSVIMGGDDGCKKPSGDLLTRALKMLMIPEDAALMVGDSLDDLKAAAAANISFVGVNYGYTPLSVHNTAIILSDFSQLIR